MKKKIVVGVTAAVVLIAILAIAGVPTEKLVIGVCVAIAAILVPVLVWAIVGAVRQRKADAVAAEEQAERDYQEAISGGSKKGEAA